MRIHLVAAARPNFMKIAPLYHAIRRQSGWVPVLIHTGQHYDANMSEAFFRDLRLPRPDHHLEVGSGTHAEQTGGVMMAYERVAVADRPTCIVVVGDVNSTVACALVGAKARIPVVHLEAGLRSRDRSMPEEINRLATDAISDVLWTPSGDADENLLNEGVSRERIELVGNVMIDSYEMLRTEIERDATPSALGLLQGRYAVVTLHRPSNVDRAESLGQLVEELQWAAARLPIVFPLHPRTRSRLQAFGLMDRLRSAPGVTLCDPLGYVQFMSVVCGAKGVITDSGGVQEETTYLGIPCLTLRDNTERPVTVSLGTNRLVRLDAFRDAVTVLVSGGWPVGTVPPLWDGHTAQRCVNSLQRRFGG
ncbi:MAG: UDP-N-acetylglucosamine 2-epimerase (non-hydrolyzing) [Steroidobacteraceae bacterium]|nr:UDP-N-acetylglucosamine 2-epimerase (non-hydrolyzing) [Steroidobacteraceae bacterium]